MLNEIRKLTSTDQCSHAILSSIGNRDSLIRESSADDLDPLITESFGDNLDLLIVKSRVDNLDSLIPFDDNFDLLVLTKTRI
ncbi:hypothetical protein LOAG_01744 [Loa loa]|uniref:Uncharacterized protein n=1 Tax=Loa loa TaxID=7209 RepID=A0A1I7VST4_LOALO|nr:hypothetical protein LOAG_01744 [Loa loa]EFO26744.2 hypothetical protein LOAG_01744 [Loa loa]